jgi:hypothetical protein
MKKMLFLVLVGLALVTSSVFGGGIRDSVLGKPGGADASTTSGASNVPNRPSVAEGADVAEVAVQDYVPRRNPAVVFAIGDVIAKPAEALQPEVERLPPPVYTISGVKGREISEGDPLEAVDIVVTLPNSEVFSVGLIEGQDVSSWILNLPDGLEALAHRVKKGDSTVKIFVSGTPKETLRDTIRLTIPGDFLGRGTALEFTTPTEPASRKVWEDSQTDSY